MLVGNKKNEQVERTDDKELSVVVEWDQKMKKRHGWIWHKSPRYGHVCSCSFRVVFDNDFLSEKDLVNLSNVLKGELIELKRSF